ncbi:protein AF-10 isoform X2 [Neocloeon triangulifer]|uniref:protein AF-10 isoform X2 n=1 Tax=Neocloeon triangulifer TaxID=2078957 RepID=UPI00286ECBC7|nr:protein AF-10 isoform X2 [Neocloeon triangulifer]
MKEMVGGCCVCSDERGWSENPLVYCDGQGCTVAVHQACYGIVTVPSGPWFCRKCESQERAARVRCELCPSKEGALKRTDNNGWAHVICALYIPEVRFGNVTTMEPIVLHHIPSERYSKTCYICEEMGKAGRASIGACMQCNKAGCKQQFHVTCAQAMGLLCEEAGNYQDNVKYCGYCQHHYAKLKKGGNVKTIPAYKPVSFDAGSTSSDAASEKDTPPKGHQSKRKGGRGGAVTPKAALEPEKPAPADPPPSTPPTTSSSTTPTPKFTASNFVEVTPAPVAASGGKKRKSNARNSPTPPIVPKEEEVEVEKKIKLEDQSQEVAPPPAKSPKVVPVLIQNPSVVVATPPAASSLPPQASPPPSSGGGLVFSTTSSHPQLSVSVDGAARDSASMMDAAKMFGLPLETPPAKPRGRSQSIEKAEKVARKQRKKSPVGRRGKMSNLASPPLEQPSTSSDTSAMPPMNSLQQFSNIAASAAPVVVPSRPHEESSVPDSMRKGMQHSPKTTAAKAPKEPKEYKIFRSFFHDRYQNGVGSAPHMLGNVLNPTSSMAQKMTDTLNAELEAHSVFTPSMSSSGLVGPPLPSKVIASTRNNINNMLGLGSPNSSQSSGNSFSSALAGVPGAVTNMPQSLDQLLERQWEQGSQFLMEQAQHFDIASLLTCLHQLRAENIRLEEHVLNLQQRRDHLLAVNARLAIPLPPTQPVTAAMRSTPPQQRSAIPPPMNNYPVENGMAAEASILASFTNRSPIASSSERNFGGQPAPPPPPPSQMSRNSYYERQSPAGSGSNQAPPPQPQQQQQQTSPHSNNIGTLRMNPLTMAEQFRREESRSRGGPPMPQMQMYPSYQAVSPPVAQSSSHVPVVTSHQPMVIRREGMPMEHSNLMLHMHHHQKQS